MPDYDRHDWIGSAAGAPRRSHRSGGARSCGPGVRSGGRSGARRDPGRCSQRPGGRAVSSNAADSGAPAVSSSGSASTPAATAGGLQIASPDNPVTWPIYDDNPDRRRLHPEKNATLRLYNYADYIDPGAIKSFEKKYEAYNVKVRSRPSTTPTRR